MCANHSNGVSGLMRDGRLAEDSLERKKSYLD